jgi:hypothetical protein
MVTFVIIVHIITPMIMIMLAVIFLIITPYFITPIKNFFMITLTKIYLIILYLFTL